MTSQQKAASNRKNAQKSTGPRSIAGKLQSRHNALRHGLAVSVGALSDSAVEIEKVALDISRSFGLTKIPDTVRHAAEATVDLVRIRRVRASLMNRDLYTPDAISELVCEIQKLERYERRALSQRKRSLRALNSKNISIKF